MSMGQTITQKILAAHCGRDEVHPGEIIMADIDLALGNDITAPISIKILRERGIKEVFDRDRVALVPDHFALTRTSLQPSSARTSESSPAISI